VASVLLIPERSSMPRYRFLDVSQEPNRGRASYILSDCSADSKIGISVAVYWAASSEDSVLKSRIYEMIGWSHRGWLDLLPAHAGYDMILC